MNEQLELSSLFPQHITGRREFMRAGVGLGFAAAVSPIAAQTAINTDTEGLSAGEISIATPKDKIPGYRAKPAKGDKFPVVLVVSEIFGVHQHIADLCRRLAKIGYYAIAPELFIRQGDVTDKGTIKEVMDIVGQVPDAQVLGDLDACVAFASADGADTAKLAITGFCWGGRITWLYAAHNKSLKAATAWYGRLAGATNAGLQPKNPVDIATQVNAPVLGLYGGKDAGIPLESIGAMKAALAGGGVAARACRFIVYPDAGHAFNADYRPSYDREAAEDGWKRMLDWFKKYGV